MWVTLLGFAAFLVMEIQRVLLQGGPLLVINGVIIPINGLINR